MLDIFTGLAVMVVRGRQLVTVTIKVGHKVFEIYNATRSIGPEL